MNKQDHNSPIMSKDSNASTNLNMSGKSGVSLSNPGTRLIPLQLHDFRLRLLKVRSQGKEAIEPGWNSRANYSHNDPRLVEWIHTGGNYGITAPSGFACFIDADTAEIQESLESKLPQTFRYSTGKPGHFQYVYFIEDGPVGCLPLVGGGYIKGKGGYVIGPGSVHPNGVVYGSREIRDIPVAYVTKEALLKALAPFLLKKSQSSPPNSPIYKRDSPVTEEQIQKVATELLPGWIKADHVRHNLTLALIGTCERVGWSRSEVQALVDTLIRDSGKGQEHSAQVRYAYGRGDRRYGIPTLKQVLEDLL